MDPSASQPASPSAAPPAAPPWHAPGGVPASAFEQFWAASSLDAASVGPFFEQADGYKAAPDAALLLAGTGSAVPIETREQQPLRDGGSAGTGLAGLLRARRSEREYPDRPLSEESLRALLSFLAPPVRPDAPTAVTRPWPSAGGLAGVQVHLVARRVEGRFGGRVHRYLFDEHALADVGPVPSDEVLGQLFPGRDDDPAAFLVIGALAGPSLAKYDERGGRFVLLEAGAAAQTLSLAAAELGLPACLLGGLLDAGVADLVGAAATEYRPVLALAVGA